MRKEIFFAIFAGGIIGLVIAFGVWKTNQAFKPKTEEAGEPIQQIVSNSNLEFGLTLATPESEDVITENPVVITGATKSNSFVNVSGEEEDITLKSSQDGSFEAEIDLVGGVNQVIVTVFDENGNSIEEKLTLVYSTEFDN